MAALPCWGEGDGAGGPTLGRGRGTGTPQHAEPPHCSSVSPRPPCCPSLSLEMGTKPGAGVQARLRGRVPAPGARCPCPPGRGGDNGALCRPPCPAPNPGHGAGGRAPRGGAGGFKGQSRPVSPVPGVPEPSSPARSQATKVPGAGVGDTAVPAWGPQGHPPARGGAGTRRSPRW